MANFELKRVAEVIDQFSIIGKAYSVTPYGNGHINRTYVVETDTENGKKRYILQAISSIAFKNPIVVMDNIQKVTAFMSEKFDDPRSVLHVVYTNSGPCYHIDSDKNIWRMYDFIEDSICLELPESKEDFRQCAIAFGQFQQYLSDFPAETLVDTIPDFHNTPKRYEAFLAAVKEDKMGRAKDVKAEIEFVKAREDFYDVLMRANREGILPLRVTHNDTKSNNVMLDKDTRKALCVIDLDTVMPGFSVTDFGDSIRFGASTAPEDEKDLDKVWMDIEMYKAYIDGFLEGCGGMLSNDEIMLMPEGAKMMTVECGMRFLTDYLNGDTYFKISYPEQNLDRCRTQFKLVSDMEKKWDEMKEIAKSYTK